MSTAALNTDQLLTALRELGREHRELAEIRVSLLYYQRATETLPQTVDRLALVMQALIRRACEKHDGGPDCGKCAHRMQFWDVTDAIRFCIGTSSQVLLVDDLGTTPADAFERAAVVVTKSGRVVKNRYGDVTPPLGACARRFTRWDYSFLLPTRHECVLAIDHEGLCTDASSATRPLRPYDATPVQTGGSGPSLPCGVQYKTFDGSVPTCQLPAKHDGNHGQDRCLHTYRYRPSDPYQQCVKVLGHGNMHTWESPVPARCPGSRLAGTRWCVRSAAHDGQHVDRDGYEW